jgi:hypothetical protein
MHFGGVSALASLPTVQKLTIVQPLMAQIEAARACSDRLLAQSLDETLRVQLELAVRNLDEAAEWLRSDNFDIRPPLQHIARSAIELAKARIQTVDDILRRYGPDAMLI